VDVARRRGQRLKKLRQLTVVQRPRKKGEKNELVELLTTTDWEKPSSARE